MQADKVDMYLMTNGKSFPAEQTVVLRENLLKLDDSQFLAVQSTEIKNPTTMLIISIFLGALGVDRFMLGQIGIGILKLLTGGVCGILALIDWITISKKTRQWNFDKVMLTLQTLGTGNDAGTGTVNALESSSASTVNSAATATVPPLPKQAPQKPKSSSTVAISGKGALAFIKAFVKNPIGAMRETSLSFSESLIFAGAQALGLALTLLVLSFRGGSLPIIGSMFGAFNYGYGASRVMLVLQAVFICAILIVTLTAATLFFGKVVFKGSFGGSGDFKKLIGYVITAEVPLTLALVASIVVGLIAPPLVLVLVAIGVVAAILLEASVFTFVFGLSEDQATYATISTYTLQVVVMLVMSLLGA